MLNQIKNANSLSELQILYSNTFGKNGSITEKLKQMKNLSPDERAIINREKDELSAAFKSRQAELELAEIMSDLEKNKLDATATQQSAISNPRAPTTSEARCWVGQQSGRLHPLTRAFSEISEILTDMGYGMRAGPEIEDDWHNFTALNTPAHHPARDMQDTFFMTSGDVLRTQTSAVQIRAMETDGAPIKIFAPGATYRREMDATHSPMFHQVEGLYIGKNITMNDMIRDIKTFLERFFGREFNMRIRPSYFPFTEPSIEVDVEWKPGKWLEMGGAGMVHPNVLRACDINPDEFLGFAFGCGMDRLAMLKYGLSDIRKFYDGDARWMRANGVN